MGLSRFSFMKTADPRFLKNLDIVAAWPSGKAWDCKALIRGFDSPRGLKILRNRDKTAMRGFESRPGLQKTRSVFFWHGRNARTRVSSGGESRSVARAAGAASAARWGRGRARGSGR